MERFDAAIIGAGANGLAAALTLARAGLRTIVLERGDEPGGRAATIEFHPGFRVAPWCDELAAIPAQLFWAFDPARHGTVLAPATVSACISETGTSVFYNDPRRAAAFLPWADADAALRLRDEIAADRRAIAARAAAGGRPPGRFSWRRPAPEPWPGERWCAQSLADAIAARVGSPALQCHLAAAAASGRAVSPYLAGSALYLLADGPGSGTGAAGLAPFALAMAEAVEAAGATMRWQAAVAELKIVKHRARAAVLLGGEEVEARAFLSSLDAKRSFLGLVNWNELPNDFARRANQYRMQGAAGRVLFALDRPPKFTSLNADAARGPIHIVESMRALSLAHDAWRAGTLAESLPVTLRLFTDPRAAPLGKAAMTATVSGVPPRLFDGPWTDEKRARVKDVALAAAERVSPGIGRRIIAWRTLVPSDAEEALGLSGGDLDGGELAPDQTLGFRPFEEWNDGRTPISGYYLGGTSSEPSPFFTGAAGVRAAHALMTDMKAGRLK